MLKRFLLSLVVLLFCGTVVPVSGQEAVKNELARQQVELLVKLLPKKVRSQTFRSDTVYQSVFNGSWIVPAGWQVTLVCEAKPKRQYIVLAQNTVEKDEIPPNAGGWEIFEVKKTGIRLDLPLEVTIPKGSIGLINSVASNALNWLLSLPDVK